EEADRPGAVSRILPRCVAAAAVVVGILALPGLNDRLYEEHLYAATRNVEPGEEKPFQRYLTVFGTGRRAEEVRDAFEEYLARHAADSPPGPADRFERYLQLFSQGRLTDQVRAGYEEHLYNSARSAGPGTEDPFRRYLAVFPRGRHVSEV